MCKSDGDVRAYDNVMKRIARYRKGAMTRRQMLKASAATVGTALTAAFYADNNAASGQWPGEESATGTMADGWPSSIDDRLDSDGHYVPENADTFVCTFDLARQAHALNQLETMPSGKIRCPQGGSNYGNYFSGNRRQALEELIKEAGVRQDRIIAMEVHNFQNAAAVLCEEGDGEIKQLVMWDPDFLAKLDREAGTEWASVAVLAHELAHHLNNDTGQNPGRIPPHERRQQELYADRYAGQKLRQFGASKQEAVAVFHEMGEGGDTHPPSRQRVRAAGEGWDSASGKSSNPSNTGNSNHPGNTNHVRWASACMTNYGYCAWDPMAPRVPVGSSCFCPSYYGPIPGIAQ